MAELHEEMQSEIERLRLQVNYEIHLADELAEALKEAMGFRSDDKEWIAWWPKWIAALARWEEARRDSA